MRRREIQGPMSKNVMYASPCTLINEFLIERGGLLTVRRRGGKQIVGIGNSRKSERGVVLPAARKENRCLNSMEPHSQTAPEEESFLKNVNKRRKLF
jgi:hypothetical protein